MVSQKTVTLHRSLLLPFPPTRNANTPPAPGGGGGGGGRWWGGGPHGSAGVKWVQIPIKFLASTTTGSSHRGIWVYDG